MQFLNFITWRGIRATLLAVLILLFAVGVTVLFSRGNHTGPAVSNVAVSSTEDFGQYLSDHYALLAPFFDRNRQDMVEQGVPLLLEVMGDVILLNMAIGWILDIGLGFGFSFLFAPLYAKPQQAILYASWRLGLDIIVFVMASLGSFGLEQLGSWVPVGLIIAVFVIVDILVQSFLVANIYATGAVVSTTFYVFLLIIHLLVGALLTGTLIKKRVSIMLAQFVDVASVTTQLEEATGTANRDLETAKEARDDARSALAASQDQLDQTRKQQEDLRNDIQAKQNSEPFVYGRIIRIRAQGDLAGARTQLVAFLAKFPNGTLNKTAKDQLDLVNQDLATQSAQQKQAEADAVAATAQARADLLARAAKGEVTLSEMRKALVGKAPGDVVALFGQPTEMASDRWGYGQQMVINTMTNQKYGLAIYFTEGTVQGVDYYYGRGGAR